MVNGRSGPMNHSTGYTFAPQTYRPSYKTSNRQRPRGKNNLGAEVVEDFTVIHEATYHCVNFPERNEPHGSAHLV